METKLREEVVTDMKIPVVSKNGMALMPCKPSKVRKLITKGMAEKKWSKLGIFYIRLNFDLQSEPNKKQQMCIGIDPGSKFDGIAVVSSKSIQQTGMLELPKGIAKKIGDRRQMRRERRYRKCRRRPSRFDNRTRKEDWISPSQKSKVDFRLKIVDEHRKLYPITDYAVEDVAFNHYKKRWGKYFSTVEIGKTMLYERLSSYGKVHMFKGIDTAELRAEYGLEKDDRKSNRNFNTHAVDAVAIASKVCGLTNFDISSFYVWKRYQNRRRQLHKVQFKKGGERPREGGSQSIPPFKKNDVVIHREHLARVGGYMNGRISLHRYTIDNKRFTQNANPDECIRLFNQKIMSQFIPPINGVGFLATKR